MARCSLSVAGSRRGRRPSVATPGSRCDHRPELVRSQQPIGPAERRWAQQPHALRRAQRRLASPSQLRPGAACESRSCGHGDAEADALRLVALPGCSSCLGCSSCQRWSSEGACSAPCTLHERRALQSAAQPCRPEAAYPPPHALHGQTRLARARASFGACLRWTRHVRRRPSTASVPPLVQTPRSPSWRPPCLRTDRKMVRSFRRGRGARRSAGTRDERIRRRSYTTRAGTRARGGVAEASAADRVVTA